MKTLSSALWALGGLAALAGAQSTAPSAEELRPELPQLQPLVQEWRANHGASWRVRQDRLTGSAEMLYGGSAEGPLRPSSDAEWVAQARHFVDATRPMHVVPSEQLVADRVAFLPMGLAGSTDKMTVHFRQVVGGLAVENGWVSVLMDLEGRLLSVHNTTVPGLVDLETTPTVDLASARRTAVQAFQADHGEPTEVRATELQIVRLEGDTVTARTAWVTEVLRTTGDEDPAGEAIAVDARTGRVLRRPTVIHHFDVGGQVLSNATPGTDPDTASNPEAQLPMPYLRVTSSAGTVFTDANGNFNFPGVNGPLQIDVEYRGSFNNVNNNAGADYTASFTGQTGQGNVFVMNPASGALVTSQANAYLHINTVRDFIRETDPTDDTADFLATSNANLSSTCNAFFDGGSVNYYQAGGGCVNTAYSTVVAHEYGHWLNVLYSTGNGSDGMGEGNADMWAMYTFDVPVVGADFCGTNCNIRTGNNTRQYCGDGNSGCHGGVHANGEVWMGAGWKIRRNLKNTYGPSAGSMIADALFMGWMNGYNQTQIDSIIEIQWLTLDDDDGNIDNGTPNYGDIDGAFRDQGFPGFDLAFISYANVTQVPDQNSTGPFPVSATITAEIAPALDSATLFWRSVGGSYLSVPMTQGGGNVWSASIPSQSLPNAVEYYLSSEDSLGNVETFPEGGAGDPLFFGLGTPVDAFAYDFEAAGNEGWTVGAPGDGATTGIWVRGDPVPTAAQPGDDVSNPGVNCWFTGQGSPGGGIGDNDVDNGATTLLSPVFDATALAGANIRYWRWFSNNQGASPGQDVFRISLSGDGGATWTQVDQAGPSQDAGGGWVESQFFIQTYMTPTANMRLRFVAEDAGSGSIVEAAIDEVRLSGFEGDCPAPTNYGPAKVNSQLVLALLQTEGSPSLTSNDFRIKTTTLLPNQPAVLFSGGTQALIPFLGGFQLVGAPIVREGIQQMSAIGEANFAVPVLAPMVGTTRFYQIWYRDPLNLDGTGVGLSDGLEVEFCD